MSSIGSRIAEERRRLHLTQRELAGLGGIHINAQGLYEVGKRVPRADYLASIAQHGVDVMYVVTGRRAPPKEEALRPDQVQLLQLFRNLILSDKKAITHIIFTLARRTTTSFLRR